MTGDELSSEGEPDLLVDGQQHYKFTTTKKKRTSDTNLEMSCGVRETGRAGDWRWAVE